MKPGSFYQPLSVEHPSALKPLQRLTDFFHPLLLSFRERQRQD